MNMARLNFSRGDFSSHEEAIRNLRAATRASGRRLAIQEDLPDPKIRTGQLTREPLELQPDSILTLTTQYIIRNGHRVSISFTDLPRWQDHPRSTPGKTTGWK